MITVSQFKTAITGKLRGSSLSDIADFYGSLREAAGNVKLRVSPPETIRRARIENALYDKVYNYTAPTDVTEDGMIDIRPIGDRSTNDSNTGVYTREFDIKKGKDTFTIETINTVKTLRLSKNLTPRTTLHRCDSLTLDGTVTAGGDVTNLDIDTLDYLSGSGAISFNLSGSTGQGTLTFALDTAVDLSDMEGLGAIFEWLKFPLASALTSVRMRIGSDSSNYYESTVTAAHDRAFESDAYMLIRHLLSTATTTGTPDFANVDYIQIAINYTSGTARNGCRLETITAAKGQAWESVYYSECFFKSAAGTYLETPTADTDTILLNVEGINLLTYEFMIILAQSRKGKDMDKEVGFFELKLNGNGKKEGAYALYEKKYPSKAIEMTSTFYVFGDLSDDGWENVSDE